MYISRELLPGKSHGWRSLVGCSRWGCEESDTTERLHFHFSLSCIGEGNGNPLQCSCLENPRESRAWWAAVSGVTQSWTWLKWLSSSSGLKYFSHLMRRADSLEKTLMLGNIEVSRKRRWQRMRWLDGITDSWTWVWASSGRSEGQGSLVCCSPWDCKKLDKT